MHFFKKLLAVCFLGLSIVSCESDDPEIPNEVELITTVVYTLTPEGEGEVVVLNYKDLDGLIGEGLPVITNGDLEETTYTGVLTFLNESDEEDVEDITEEILEEDDEHQVFFSDVDGLEISYADEDDNGNPIGLQTTVVVGSGYTGGELTIVLRHQPNKFGEGVSTGDQTNAGGETDIEVTFELNPETLFSLEN